MKKISLVLIGLITQAALWAQDSTSTKILASDPTQVYTHIDFNGGINFDNYGPESWVFNFEGNIAFNNLLLGASAPISNKGNVYTLLGDLEVFAGYRLFNRDGVFKSSLLKAGVLIPTSFEGGGVSFYPENTGFFNYYLNYTAALKVTPKLSMYPLIGIRQYQSVRQDIYIYPQDSIYTAPTFSQTAINTGITLSYDFSPRSFIQFNMQYEHGKWKTSDGSDISFSGTSEFTRSTTALSLRYQYGFGQHSFIYLQGAYFSGEKWNAPFNRKIGDDRYRITLGYQYFLGK